ncbi:DNA-lyase [Coprinopsis sp. MPI-PUGE-AT-0042]|nr:DNA-lyase [Coprinopsis sp. MPI-PUGE-AT-0042]
MARNAAAPGSSSLVSHKSEFSSSVTLFTLDDIKQEDSGSPSSLVTPLRKRVKLEHAAKLEEDTLPDMEDLMTPRRSARRAKLPTTSYAELSSPLSSVPSSPEPSSSRKVKGKGKAKAKATPFKSEHLSELAPQTASPSPSKKKQKPIPQSLATPHPAPAHWKEVYDTITKMRKDIVAPVDSMGCAMAGVSEESPKSQRLSNLISLMLSSQTKDAVTAAATASLRAALGGSITLEGIIAAPPSLISDCINKVGFWRRKTEYIKKSAEALRDEFEGDVPKTVDELCSLPGVGPKMAFLCLQSAWGLNHGIGVDVHVHRITNRLGWHKRPTKNPEETRLNLQSWLPTEYHQDVNTLLVGFGQMICTPVAPKCDQCLLSTMKDENGKGLCPSAREGLKDAKKRSVKRKAVKVEVEDGDEEGGSAPTVKVEVEVKEEAQMEPEAQEGETLPITTVKVEDIKMELVKNEMP